MFDDDVVQLCAAHVDETVPYLLLPPTRVLLLKSLVVDTHVKHACPLTAANTHAHMMLLRHVRLSHAISMQLSSNKAIDIR
mmetsp:Transcript_19783/g.32943  ORF Transcript_19783/g.32943 Transcript_19783/m.32943 type:complete len:81 (+) Transcript_19783:336-578(+)